MKKNYVKLLGTSVLMMCGLMFSVHSCGGGQTLPIQTITVGDEEREYYLYTPTSTSPVSNRALLVAFHGGGGIGAKFPQQDEFEALAEKENFMIAFPQAVRRDNEEGSWLLNTPATSTERQNDKQFISALIGKLTSSPTLANSKRVYAMGYSLGSMFSYEMACHLDDKFAAIASYAGTMPVMPNSCTATNAPGLMHIHGMDDTIISYGETWDWKNWDQVGPMMDIPSLVEYWKGKYNCKRETVLMSSDSVHTIHQMCDVEKTRVEHHRLSGVGHEWPESINGTSTHQVIWDFLSGFTNP